MATYNIEDIEGIGPVLGDKLRGAGVKTTADLLEHAKTPALRKALVAASGLSDGQVLTFANMADLFRINGVAGEFAELMVAAGVDTVAELAQRRPDNLSAKMAEVNEAKKLTRRVPSEAEVTKWVEQAKELPRVLTY